LEFWIHCIEKPETGSFYLAKWSATAGREASRGHMRTQDGRYWNFHHLYRNSELYFWPQPAVPKIYTGRGARSKKPAVVVRPLVVGPNLLITQRRPQPTTHD